MCFSVILIIVLFAIVPNFDFFLARLSFFFFFFPFVISSTVALSMVFFKECLDIQQTSHVSENNQLMAPFPLRIL